MQIILSDSKGERSIAPFQTAVLKIDGAAACVIDITGEKLFLISSSHQLALESASEEVPT